MSSLDETPTATQATSALRPCLLVIPAG